MARDWRKEHEIACSALDVAKSFAGQVYEIPPKTILFQKVQKDGSVRVGYKDFSSGDNFKFIKMKEVIDKGVQIDKLPEYTDFIEEYHRLKSQLNKYFQKASYQSRCAVREGRDGYLARFYHARREIYDSYLDSPEWARKRQQCLQVHGSLCVDCKKIEATDIHHRHYETLGDECPKDDIVPLCSACHKARHDSRNLLEKAKS